MPNKHVIIYVGGILFLMGVIALAHKLWQLFQKEGSSRIYVYDYDLELK